MTDEDPMNTSTAGGRRVNAWPGRRRSAIRQHIDAAAPSNYSVGDMLVDLTIALVWFSPFFALEIWEASQGLPGSENLGSILGGGLGERVTAKGVVLYICLQVVLFYVSAVMLGLLLHTLALFLSASGNVVRTLAVVSVPARVFTPWLMGAFAIAFVSGFSLDPELEAVASSESEFGSAIFWLILAIAAFVGMAIIFGYWIWYQMVALAHVHGVAKLWPLALFVFVLQVVFYTAYYLVLTSIGLA